ncbi:MAG TPA: hypothetical protein VGQ46_03405 [Thermoanaerobaculia bacterium]|nr:hypothetical protein [Thermoanaerobaculia bacterium]
MTQKIATLAAIAFLVFGCSRSGKVQRNQQQYQTVQEGSASGVTSTINAPGETTPPLTNTNVDTTTNLTLPTNPAPLGTGTASGSMASAMPSAPSYPVGAPGVPPRARTSTRPAPVANAPVVTDTVGSTTPPMPRERTTQPARQPQPREQRPQTDTAATDTSAPPPTDTTMTDTSSTTSTSSSPDTKKKKDDGKKKDGNQNDQQPPPSPPPTQTTDTRG